VLHLGPEWTVGHGCGERLVQPVAGPGQQCAEQRAAGGEFAFGSDVEHPAVLQHRDPVGELQRRTAVGDQQRGAFGGDLA